MSEQDIILMLAEIREILKRMEERQIRTTKMVEEVEQAEPVVGSFATTNHGTK